MEYASLVEEIADWFSRWFIGYPKTPWWDALNTLTIIHIILTMLVCFIKTDFINLTLVLMLLKTKYYAEEVKWIELRMVAFAILLSWVFDLIWMFFHLGSWFSWFNPEHSDVEVSIWRFCATITFLSFVFRFVLFVVTWKISVEFDWLFKPRGTLLDEQLERFKSPPNNKQKWVFMQE